VKKIGLIVASNGYQPVEYGVPQEMLATDGFKVITISDRAGVALAKDSSTTIVDITVDQVNVVDFDGIFAIGGPGALECLDTPRVHDIFKQMQILKKAYGAICISPRILAHAGVLAGKQATGWDDDNKLSEIFSKHGVQLTNQPVVVDGNVITATGPQAAQEFAIAIVKILK
jgi:protease I